MCGICGVYEFERQRPVSPETLAAMLETIRHRGPDDEGAHFDRDVALGMRRLSIIDVAGGQQPMFNETGSVAVVFNGEVYNYKELAAELRGRGHTLKTACDTEVIAHLYEESGAACVESLRGMFAFALFDARERRLLLARDRLGVKPLYYTQVGGRLVFGSEIKAILQHPAVEARLDPAALNLYLSLKYVPAPLTMFAGISALPPGHTLTCDRDGVTLRRYWDVVFAPQDGPVREEAYAEQLEHLLRESVRLRLRSDVPFGAFLSGGLDSSLVVALMSQLLEGPVKTFSVGFAATGGASDERPYARRVASAFGSEHHEVVAGPADFVNLAEKVVWHLDQPIADQATAATYLLSGLASDHVKMVLTGEGGDELFAGYARYAGERLSPPFGALSPSAKRLALGLSARLPGLRRPKLALNALLQKDESARFAEWFPLFNRDMKGALLSPALRDVLEQETEYGTNHGASPEADRLFAEHLARTSAAAPLNRMLYVDTKLWLPDFLLLRGDKLSMANSLEARVPLLDHTLVEFAASLPPQLKLKRLTRKYLLKKVGRELLPSAVVDRKKEGFPIPISAWLRGEARPFVRDLLAPSALRRRGLFDPGYVDALLRDHESGFADHGMLLWGLASVEIWHRLFIDAATHPSTPAPAPRAWGVQEKAQP